MKIGQSNVGLTYRRTDRQTNYLETIVEFMFVEKLKFKNFFLKIYIMKYNYPLCFGNDILSF